MFDSITIKKFKKIWNIWITLSNLWRVNYFVGENGCGKSSVIEWIYAWLKNIKYKNFPSMSVSLTPNKWTPLTLVHQNNILNSNYKVWKLRDSESNSGLTNTSWMMLWNLDYKDVIEYSHLDLLGVRWWDFDKQTDLPKITKEKTIQLFNEIFEKQLIIKWVQKTLWNPDKWETSLQFYVEDKKSKKYNLNFMAWWYIYILKLALLLSLDIYKNNNIIIIEEPEQQLHPKIQKMIPKLIQVLCDKYPKKQFFITTHSPFIISWASEFLDQKVYLLEDGQTKDLEWNLWTVESHNWYYGYECKKVVNKMLWVWFDDFQNKIIVCEWDPEWTWVKHVFDERMYSIIFANKKWYSFVSSWWWTLYKNTYVAKKIFEDGIFCIIKDPDWKSKNDLKKEKDKFSKNWIILNHLTRRDLESYLLDYNVIERFFKSKWFTLSDAFKEEYEKTNISGNWNLKHENSEKIVHIIQKALHSESWWTIVNYAKNELFQDLAKIIYDHKSDGWSIQALYEELEQCIFENT